MRYHFYGIILLQDRPCGTITAEKVSFAHEHPPIESFEESVATLKPTAIIGECVYIDINLF